MNKQYINLLVLLFVLLIIITGVTHAQAASNVPERTMLVGDSIVLECRNLARVAVSDPVIADVSAPSSSELLIIAKASGRTTIYLWDSNGRRSFVIQVQDVKLDVDKLIADISKQIDDPRVKVRAVGNTIILEGTVSREPESARAQSIAEAVVEVAVYRGPLTGTKSQEMASVATPTAESALVEKVATSRETSIAAQYALRTARVVNLIQVERQFNEVSARTLETAAAIKQGLNTPSLAIRALPTGVIIVEGQVGTEAELAQISLLLKAWNKEGKDDKGGASSTQMVENISIVNAVTVNSSLARQILLRAQVVDINKDSAKEVGLDWGRMDLINNKEIVIDQPFNIGQPYGHHENFGGLTNIHGIGARIMALEDQKKAKTLAKPNLTVLDGKEGSILVGGEIPVPVAQTVGGAAGGISIQWKQFGVFLTFVPTITGDDTIQLKVEPEVSTLDFTNAVTLGGFEIPAVRTRRAQTIVNVRNGESFALGGLLSSNTSQLVRKVPLLGDLPIIGELFKSRNWVKGETELVIVITPEILKPTATASAGP